MGSNFAKNFKALRKERNMTQAEMGEILKISPMTVRRWENGSREPKMSTIEKIADVLEVDLLDLISTNDIVQYSREILDRMGGVKTLREEAAQIKIISNKAQKLNSEGREKVISYVDDLVQIPEYRKKDNED